MEAYTGAELIVQHVMYSIKRKIYNHYKANQWARLVNVL